MKRSNGEGTIFKRSDGRWCAAFYDDAPCPRRHFVYGSTQAEVKKKLKAKKAELEKGEEKRKQLIHWNSGYCIILILIRKMK